MPPGIHNIGLSANLASGQTAVAGFHLQIVDRTVPTLTAPANGFSPVQLDSGSAIPNYLVQVAAQDNVAVTRLTQTPVAGALATTSTNMVVITGTDAKGNTTSLNIPVQVSAPEVGTG
jgi:hypothetical protein